jgi:hypothetical protein
LSARPTHHHPLDRSRNPIESEATKRIAKIPIG